MPSQQFKKLGKNIRQVLANGGKAALLRATSDKRKRLERSRPLCIEAIAVTCGGLLKDQLLPFLQQVQFYHPEWPIHIATDLETYETVSHLIRPEDRVWLIKEKDLQHYATVSKQKNHLINGANRWSKGWIGIKLENFRRAINAFDCGVLQCDSDFVFTRALDKINWRADIVLSTHHGPFVDRGTPEEHGYFNAGLLLSDQPFIAEKWIELYNSGVGGFYEQKCLEHFAEHYVSDTFPSSWNWGIWRRTEDVSYNGRIPPIIHIHLDGPYKQDSGGDRALFNLASKRMAMNKRSYNTHPRYAFYHCSKAAGSTVSNILHTRVVNNLQYQILDSYREPTPRTDWTEPELLQFCFNGHPYQEGNRFIVHNHGQNWTPTAIDLYLYNDWRFFAFYRPIRERLCSFYAWSIDVLQKTGENPMGDGPISRAGTINEFLTILLTEPEYQAEWQLPQRYAEFNWYPATSIGIAKWAKDCFNLILSQEEILVANNSSNRGWSQYVADGIINQATFQLVENSTAIKEWDNLIEQQEAKHGKVKR